MCARKPGEAAGVSGSLSIGEASDRVGLTPDTLRYYERIGLLVHVARNTGGQRRYDSDDLARMQFIRRAQAMDFSLDEIGQLLALRDAGGDARADVRALTEHKLAAIEARIATLSSLRDELVQLIAACRASAHDCPIIGHMQDDPDEPSCNGRTAEGEMS